MKLAGNLSLCFAALLLIYPFIPNLPALRAAILRLEHGGPIGPIYALFFWLMPQFLRLMLASLTMWSLLIVAMVAAIYYGGLDWLGISRLMQCLLIGAACFAMAEISVLIGLTYDDPNYSIPGIVRVISPWAGWVLPLIVLSFAFASINPSLTGSVSPWIYRGALMAAFFLSLPIGGVLLVRWITPPPPVATIHS